MSKHQRGQLSFRRISSIFLSTFFLLLLVSTDIFSQTTSTLTSTKLFRFPISPNRIEIISGGEAPLSDESVGLEALITVTETPAPGPPGQEQETWVWHYFNPSGVLVATRTLFFFADGAQLGIPGGIRNCFFLAGDAFASCQVTSFFQTIQLNTRCMELGTFQVQLDHTRVLEGFTETTTSQTFTVVSTGPATQVQLSHTTINPEVIGGGNPQILNIEAGETLVTVTVTDSDCTNIPLESAKVTLSSRTIPGSGGHAHLGEREGTGTFILGPSGSLTDQFGEMKATYTAGVSGLEEDIIAKAEFLGKISEPDKTGTANLTIKIEGLSPLPVVPQEYILIGGTDKHQAGTNHFGTTDMVFRVFNIARMFRQLRTEFFGLTGVLRINDMSLPFGGVFDLNGQLNVAGGHKSHETGIDVDIDPKDSNGVSTVPQRPLLNGIARSIFGCAAVSEIHFRCSLSIPGQ